MKVSLKTIMPLAAAALLAGASSCSSVDDRAKKYMIDNNYTQKDLNSITESMYPTTVQSKLDSAAYRDIFMSTEAAKDSAATAEFNKIAARFRANEDAGASKNKISDIKNKATDAGISAKTMDYIDKSADISFIYSDVPKANIYQHLVDDWAYRTFFKKIGLSDSIFNKCDEVSRKIAPAVKNEVVDLE